MIYVFYVFLYDYLVATYTELYKPMDLKLYAWKSRNIYRKNCLERKQSVSYLQLSCIKCLNLKVWASVLMLKCTWCCSPLPQTQPWYETQHPLKKSNSSTFFMLSLRCKRRLHVTWGGTMGLIKAKEVNKHAEGA